MIQPVCVVIAVGLSPRQLEDPGLTEIGPVLHEMMTAGGSGTLHTVGPAVTMAQQATMLTGQPPSVHGVVGNGWHYRDTDEIRFWQQSRRLIQAPLIYETARQRATANGETFTAANLFGWFNQGSRVEYAVTPKPWYGADGRKEFDVHGKPDHFVSGLKHELGEFPFFTFWGPMAGAPCTEWIALAATHTLFRHRPTFSLVYLPHLDYDLQRFGPHGPHQRAAIEVLDNAIGRIRTACKDTGTKLVVLSEYAITEVRRHVALNRVLRSAGLLQVRRGPFGELIDVPDTPAVAVVDHQVAHVSVADPADIEKVAGILRNTEGVARVLVGEERDDFSVNHPRAGEIVCLADPKTWFSWEYWQNPSAAPDFAPTVDIHRKPGYDPLELFFDPRKTAVKARVAWRVLRKKLGMRYLMDVIPVDQQQLVLGSHGLPAADPADGAVVVTEDPALAQSLPESMTDVHDWLLAVMFDRG